MLQVHIANEEYWQSRLPAHTAMQVVKGYYKLVLNGFIQLKTPSEGRDNEWEMIRTVGGLGKIMHGCG